MNKTVKKIIGVILAMITVFSFLSISVYAEDNSSIEENIQITEEKEDNSNPLSDMNIVEATEKSIAMFAVGVISLPLLAVAPLGFLIMPPFGVSLAMLPIIGLSSIYFYFEALFTGQFWD